MRSLEGLALELLAVFGGFLAYATIRRLGRDRPSRRRRATQLLAQRLVDLGVFTDRDTPPLLPPSTDPRPTRIAGPTPRPACSDQRRPVAAPDADPPPDG